MVLPLCAMFLLLLSVQFAAGINLSSTQSEQGACLGDVIVFTCTVTGAGILEWKLDNTPLVHFNIEGEMSEDEGSNHIVNVTLTNVESDPMNPLLGNLTSELTISVSEDTILKHVQCSDGQVRTVSSIIKKQCKLCGLLYLIILSQYHSIPYSLI